MGEKMQEGIQTEPGMLEEKGQGAVTARKQEKILLNSGRTP